MQLYPKRDFCFGPWLCYTRGISAFCQEAGTSFVLSDKHCKHRLNCHYLSASLKWDFGCSPQLLNDSLGGLHNLSWTNTWQTWHKSLAPWNLIEKKTTRDSWIAMLFSSDRRENWRSESVADQRDCKLQVAASFWISSRNSCFISPTPPWKCLVASQLNQDGLFRSTSANLCKVQRFTCSTSSSHFNSRWLCWSGTSYGDSGLAIAPVDGGTHRCSWNAAFGTQFWKLKGKHGPSFKVEGMLYASACNKRAMICIYT